MTRTKIFRIINIISCCLLMVATFVTVTYAEANGSYQVESGSISGGTYRVEMVSWQVSGSSSSESLTLVSLAASDSPALGCCCTYLPCLLRQP